MTEVEHREWWKNHTEVPYGHCWCGFEKRTRLATRTDPRRDTWEGFPGNFIRSHHSQNRIYNDVGELLCASCGSFKSQDEFSWVKAKTRPATPYSYCKVCTTQKSLTYYGRHKDIVRAKYFAKTYGLLQEDIQALLVDQGHRCKICRCDFTEKQFVVDHCHETGKVRGLLCTLCNTSLGGFRDSPDILLSAVSYLEEAKSR